MCMSFRTYRKDVNPFETDTKGRHFIVDVSVNWPSNRNWQIKVCDSWGTSQLKLLLQKSVNHSARSLETSAAPDVTNRLVGHRYLLRRAVQTVNVSTADCKIDILSWLWGQRSCLDVGAVKGALISPPWWPSAQASVFRHSLVGLMVNASSSRAEDSGLDSRLCRGDFSWSSLTSDLKIGAPVVTLPGVWHYRVSAGTGWPLVGILWGRKLDLQLLSRCGST